MCFRKRVIKKETELVRDIREHRMVFCKYCKFGYELDLSMLQECHHKSNKKSTNTLYREPSSRSNFEYLRQPREINQQNDCQNFEYKTWYKLFPPRAFYKEDFEK
jgi:hypothetical protein